MERSTPDILSDLNWGVLALVYGEPSRSRQSQLKSLIVELRTRNAEFGLSLLDFNKRVEEVGSLLNSLFKATASGKDPAEFRACLCSLGASLKARSKIETYSK